MTRLEKAGTTMECGATEWKGGSSWMSVDEEDGESNDEGIAEEDEEDNEIELIVQAGFMLILTQSRAKSCRPIFCRANPSPFRRSSW